MKRFIACALLALGLIGLLATNAVAQEQPKFPIIVSGVAMGWQLDGPEKGDKWTLGWAGVKAPIGSILPWLDDGTKALYVVTQYGDNQSRDAVIGGKVLLSAMTPWSKYVFFNTAVGWLPEMAERGDGTEDALTLDMGLAVIMSPRINLIVHLQAVDRGPSFVGVGYVGFGFDL
jgi:hypothetical protein